jgi:hypothetical protein
VLGEAGSIGQGVCKVPGYGRDPCESGCEG